MLLKCIDGTKKQHIYVEQWQLANVNKLVNINKTMLQLRFIGFITSVYGCRRASGVLSAG